MILDTSVEIMRQEWKLPEFTHWQFIRTQHPIGHVQSIYLDITSIHRFPSGSKLLVCWRPDFTTMDAVTFMQHMETHQREEFIL